METKFLQFLFFSTGLGGIIFSGILISSQKFFSKNFFLSLCMFCLCMSSIYNFFFMEGLLNNFPFFFIINKSCSYLIAPSAYLYIRNIFNGENPQKQLDWIHFIPFVFVVTILSNMALQNPWTVQNAIANNSSNWFINIRHANIYYLLSIGRYLLWLVYIVLQSLCIINFERRKKPKSFQYNSRLVNWIKSFNINLIILFILLLVQRVFKISSVNADYVNDITMSVILLITIGFLITKPHILYSLEDVGISLFSSDTGTGTIPEVNPRITNAIVKPLFSVKKKDEYLDILNQVLVDDKPYLNKGITVKELSDRTGIPAHHLSYLINIEFNLHFQDFINLKRIEYLKSKIDDIEWKQLTLEGICWEIGFTSRTTFFRAFIKLTGVSPSEYFRNIKKNNIA